MIMVVSVFMVNQAQGGTLDRGVHISSFFAGWTNGDSTIAQLKYQMAIDAKIGITDRYVTVMYTYNYNYNSGVFNTFEVDAMGEANVTINNNTYPE